MKYLYTRGTVIDEIHLVFHRYRVTKVTTRRVFFDRNFDVVTADDKLFAEQWSRDHGIGFVNRRELDTYGSARHGVVFTLYASFEAMAAKVRLNGAGQPVDLGALKAEMVRAHPDRGGTSEAFIKAHAKYAAARRNYRG